MGHVPPLPPWDPNFQAWIREEARKAERRMQLIVICAALFFLLAVLIFAKHFQ